ncbi:MAG: methyltransferase domain-containing protein, partial [Caldilineaceae bacterium]|nr:methyltransferase domain-containing protein [Caldilineaceae bacterium]
YLPFPQILPGFSWVQLVAKQHTDPRLEVLVKDKHREMRNVLFRAVDFASVQRAMDIGCGYSSDLVRLAREHPHLHLDGFTISPSQVTMGTRKIERAGLHDRVRVHYADSTKDPFPAPCELVYGVEVLVHIKDKGAVFANMDDHLHDGGYLVMADFTSNIRTEIDLDEIGTFTITKEQWLELFAAHHFALIDCVDVSQEMANSLYDPDYQRHQPQSGKDAAMVFSGYQSMDNHLHRSLKEGFVSYLLMTLRRDNSQSPAQLTESNRARLFAPTPYRQVLTQEPQRRRDTLGFFGPPTASHPVGQPTMPAVAAATPSAEQLMDALLDAIKAEIARLLGFAVADLQATMTFEELGVQS